MTQQLRLRIFAGAALLLAGCRGYYPSWRYAPRAEIHEMHVRAGDEKEPRATVAVAARLIGILRPAAGAPRRLHALLEVENRAAGAASLDPATVRAIPSGATALEPEPGSVITASPGERRSVSVYFRLPDPGLLPNASLQEIVLTWTVGVDGRALESRATFRRASVWYGEPWYWDDPWYHRSPYHHGPWGGPYYGPWWHVHAGVHVVHCD